VQKLVRIRKFVLMYACFPGCKGTKMRVLHYTASPRSYQKKRVYPPIHREPFTHADLIHPILKILKPIKIMSLGITVLRVEVFCIQTDGRSGK
jgi:hypothetical protein